VNRLINYQRDALVKLPVRTTEDERRRALSYTDRDLMRAAEQLIQIIQGEGLLPQNLGLLVAIARYEDNGWMPDGEFSRWRRWNGGHSESKTIDALVQWLEEYELSQQESRHAWQEKMKLHIEEVDREIVAKQEHLAKLNKAFVAAIDQELRFRQERV
jgi:hypothetical protein